MTATAPQRFLAFPEAVCARAFVAVTTAFILALNPQPCRASSRDSTGSTHAAAVLAASEAGAPQPSLRGPTPPPTALLPTAGLPPPSEVPAALPAHVLVSPPTAPEPLTGANENSHSEPVVLEGGISVGVARDQRVSVVGETSSLRAVIEEICRQAGIELRAYGAPDRRYVGKLENVPLFEAFRSILRAESYLVWMQASSEGEPPRVKWVRVLGAQPASGGSAMPIAATQFGTAQPVTQISPPPAERFSLSTALLFQAFGTFDPVRRDQAQREIIDRILEPEQLRRFLATDAKTLATLFGRYRDAEQTLHRLRGLSDRPEVQAKFEEVLNQVASAAEESSQP